MRTWNGCNLRELDCYINRLISPVFPLYILSYCIIKIRFYNGEMETSIKTTGSSQVLSTDLEEVSSINIEINYIPGKWIYIGAKPVFASIKLHPCCKSKHFPFKTWSVCARILQSLLTTDVNIFTPPYTK